MCAKCLYHLFDLHDVQHVLLAVSEFRRDDVAHCDVIDGQAIVALQLRDPIVFADNCDFAGFHHQTKPCPIIKNA